jgi:hypothetical protein
MVFGTMNDGINLEADSHAIRNTVPKKAISTPGNDHPGESCILSKAAKNPMTIMASEMKIETYPISGRSMP